MKLSIYDKKLAEIIKLLRQARHVKQTHIANALFINQSTYSRMENGEIQLSPGQVHQISLELHISTFQIYAIVESELNYKYYYSTLSHILNDSINHFQNNKSELNQEVAEYILKMTENKT